MVLGAEFGLQLVQALLPNPPYKAHPKSQPSATQTGNWPQKARMQQRQCWNLAAPDRHVTAAAETRCLSFVGAIVEIHAQRQHCDRRGGAGSHKSRDAQHSETFGQEQILQSQGNESTASLKIGDEQQSRVTMSSICRRVP